MIRKEALIETRSRSGLMASIVFSVITVITAAFAGYGRQMTPTVGAGLFSIALLFSAVVSLPRSFALEEESNTADFLRLVAKPHIVYWGKAIFNTAQVGATAIVLSVLFAALSNIGTGHLLLYALATAGACFCLGFAVTLCGALVAQAGNRGLLAGVIAIPMLLPVMAAQIGALRVCFGTGQLLGGITSCLGLWGFAILVGAIAPHLFAAVWKS